MTFRVHKTSDYTVMSNHHLKNKNLSLKAKGLLSLMLSLPDEWDYTVLGLAAINKDGKDSIMATLDELKNNGYLTMTRMQNSNGRFTTWSYDVYESPNHDEPQSGKPSTEKPYAEKPYTENPPQLNTNSINGSKEPTNSINTSSIKKEEKEKAEDDFVAPELLDTWKKWLKHRKQSGKPYKSDVSKKAAYDKLMELANGNTNIAEQIIMQSLEHAWLGFFELKQQYGTTANNSTCSQGAAATSAGYKEARRRIEERLREKLSGSNI